MFLRHKEDSDYDIVIADEKIDKLLKYFDINNIEYRDLGKTSSGNIDKHTMFNERNIKTLIDDKVLNIITYKEKDLDKIKKLNILIYTMKDSFVTNNMIKDKGIRIDVIELFLKILFKDELIDYPETLDFL